MSHYQSESFTQKMREMEEILKELKLSSFGDGKVQEKKVCTSLSPNILNSVVG